MKRRIFVVVLLLTCISLVARAHEGMIHVMGVLTALSDKSVTVETTDKKSVEVVLVDTTSYEQDKKAASRADLKIGDRVVIHAVKVKGVLQAHTVQFSEVSVPAR
jgi:hypothetical protein